MPVVIARVSIPSLTLQLEISLKLGRGKLPKLMEFVAIFGLQIVVLALWIGMEPYTCGRTNWYSFNLAVLRPAPDASVDRYVLA